MEGFLGHTKIMLADIDIFTGYVYNCNMRITQTIANSAIQEMAAYVYGIRYARMTSCEK